MVYGYPQGIHETRPVVCFLRMTRLTQYAKARMDQLIRAGKNPAYVAKEIGCSKRYVQTMTNRIEAFDSIENPKVMRKGPVPRFNNAMREELGWLLVTRPDYYQDELQFYFYDNWDIWVHRTTISREIKKLDLTHKRLQFEAEQRSCVERDLYLLQLSTLTAEQLVFADESSVSGKTLDRKNGYSPRGKSAVKILPKRKSHRYSLLPAYAKDGFLADPLIVNGAVDGDQFQEWLIEKVLPQMNPFPMPKSVLIIDNCRTHHVEVRISNPQ